MAPTTGVLDSFNRANSTGLGSNWTNNIFGYGGTMLDIDTNMAAPLSASYGEQWWNVAQYGSDSEVWGTVGSLPHVGGDMGLSYCIQSPGSAAADGYRLIFKRLAGTDTVELRRIDNGNNPGTLIGSIASQEIAAADGFFCEKIGSAHKVYYSVGGSGIWTQIISGTDATYGTGFVGMYSFANAGAGRWDEFGGGTVVAGGGGTVTGVPADALGDFPVPTVTGDSAATVVAPAAAATGDFPASGMNITSEVVTGPASGLGDFPAPAVSGTADATVTGVPADGTGDFPAPGVSDGSASPARGTMMMMGLGA